MRIIRYLCLFLGVIGCGSTQTKPSTFDEDPKHALAVINQCADMMTDISGVLDTTLWRSDERVKLEQLFLRSKSGNLRIDTLSPIGQPLSTVVYDGGRLLILDHPNNQLLIGAANRDVMKKFLFVDLEPEALSTLLGGCMPFVNGTPSPVSWDANVGRSAFSLVNEALVTKIWFENLGDVRRVDLLKDAQTYTLRLGEYMQYGSHKRPQRLKFDDKSRSITIEFRFSDIQMLDQIPASSFLLSPPPGAEVRPL